MLIDLKGTKHEVRSFLYELSRMPQFQILQEQETELTELDIQWSGNVAYKPCERVKAVCLHTPKKDIYLPISDLLHSEIRSGIHILVGYE